MVERLKGAGKKALEELGEKLATKEGRQQFAAIFDLTEEEVEKVIEAISRLGPTEKGNLVEKILLKYFGHEDLNLFKANFRVVDGLSKESGDIISGFWKNSKYVSIADSGRPDQLFKKFKALMGMGNLSTYETMLADLAAFEGRGSALTTEEFLKKACLCVPDEHVNTIREYIVKRCTAGWPDPETYKILLDLNGGDPNAVVDYMCNMVRPFSDLMK